MIVPDFLTARRGCAVNAGRELEKAPLEDNLLVCMLGRTDIDMFAGHYFNWSFKMKARTEMKYSERKLSKQVVNSGVQ